MRLPVQVYAWKMYMRVPGGELQYGRVSGSLTLLFCGRRFILRKGRVR